MKEQAFPMFPDKKKAPIDFDEVMDRLQEEQRWRKEMDISQDSGTFITQSQYPTLPYMLPFLTDAHIGDVGTDHKSIRRILHLTELTPNTSVLIGGDFWNNFSPGKIPDGMLGQMINPQVQAQTAEDRLNGLDKLGKVALIDGGNHEWWMSIAGYDHANTFLRELDCPVFREGGMLDVIHQAVHYRIGVKHTHWGNSKINPTNAPKRAMEYTFHGADAVLLGHTHNAAGEMFSRAGQEKVAVVGGTGKVDDTFGKKWGMGIPGRTGFTLMLWGDHKRMQLFRDIEVASWVMHNAVYAHEQGQDFSQFQKFGEDLPVKT